MMTAIDTARLSAVAQYPELIKRTTPWETVGVCLRCMREIHVAHACLRENNVEWNAVNSLQYCCPNCHFRGKVTSVSALDKKISPIPHSLYRKRLIVTNEVKRLFRPPVVEGIVEWEKLSNE